MRAFEMEIEAQHRELDTMRHQAHQRLQALLDDQDAQWGECPTPTWMQRTYGSDEKRATEALAPNSAAA